MSEINSIISTLRKRQNINILFEDINTLKKTLLRNNKKIVFPKCNALDTTVIVNANGDIKLCFFLNSIGSILNNKIEDILYSKEANNLKKMFQKKELQECFMCVVCPYYIKNIGDMPYRTS